MTVNVSKSAFNVREALNALKKKTGLFGEQLLRSETIDDFYSVTGVNKNQLINGGFDFWQRGTSLTLTGTNSSTFLADKWSTNTSSTNCVITRQERSYGDTALGAPVQFFSRWTMSASTGSSAYVHIDNKIENVKRFDDQWVTLSFWARSSVATQIGFEFVSSYGTGSENNGSTYSPYNSKGFNIDTSWKKYSLTVKTINLFGKTINDSSSSFICRFVPSSGSGYQPRWGGSLNFNGDFDLAAVQLEYGKAATPFEVKSHATELEQCKRFFQWIDNGQCFATRNSSGRARINAALVPEMRTTPTITRTSNNFVLQGDGISYSSSSTVSAQGTTSTSRYMCFDLGGFDAGMPAGTYSGSGNGATVFKLEAEI